MKTMSNIHACTLSIKRFPQNEVDTNLSKDLKSLVISPMKAIEISIKRRGNHRRLRKKTALIKPTRKSIHSTMIVPAHIAFGKSGQKQKSRFYPCPNNLCFS
jgi:hypothetical protein